MVIGILQPGYLPWLGFFEQMHRSDIFVLYDDVQYDKEGWRNRNRIKTPNGIQWLTVPVLLKSSEKPLILDVSINNKTNWRKKHLASIRQNYSKAPFFKEFIGVFEETYERDWECLLDIDMHFIRVLAECLGLGHKKIVRSSKLDIQGGRIERLIKICEIFGADVFYEGASGKNYIDEGDFLARGIKIEFQNFNHPEYRQLYGDFTPNLSVIDLLFNHGAESLGIITGTIKGEYHCE
jgi:hypothetical protein